MVMVMATNGDQVLISWKRKKRETKSYELKAIVKIECLFSWSRQIERVIGFRIDCCNIKRGTRNSMWLFKCR